MSIKVGDLVTTGCYAGLVIEKRSSRRIKDDKVWYFLVKYIIHIPRLTKSEWYHTSELDKL